MKIEPYEEDERAPFPAVTGWGTAVSIAECPTCFALVRADKLTAREHGHDQQAEQWRRDHLDEP